MLSRAVDGSPLIVPKHLQMLERSVRSYANLQCAAMMQWTGGPGSFIKCLSADTSYLRQHREYLDRLLPRLLEFEELAARVDHGFKEVFGCCLAFGWLVGWLVGWFVGQSVGWLVGWLARVRTWATEHAVGGGRSGNQKQLLLG